MVCPKLTYFCAWLLFASCCSARERWPKWPVGSTSLKYWGSFLAASCSVRLCSARSSRTFSQGCLAEWAWRTACPCCPESGAILLLLIAGIEADLVILREKVVPGMLAAAGAIGSSLAITYVVVSKLMGRSGQSSLFLGLVYSVTAVSVVAKLLIERGLRCPRRGA